jgi:ABC-type transport system substrate-binding protein
VRRRGNINGYCNPEIDKMFDRQSAESDQEKRKKLVWEIERKLAEDEARPMIFYAPGATCWQPRTRGVTVGINSIYNNWRMEDVWLPADAGDLDEYLRVSADLAATQRRVPGGNLRFSTC